MIIGLNPPFGEDGSSFGMHSFESFCHMALHSQLLPGVLSRYDRHALQHLRSSALLQLHASGSPARSCRCLQASRTSWQNNLQSMQPSCSPV